MQCKFHLSRTFELRRLSETAWPGVRSGNTKRFGGRLLMLAFVGSPVLRSQG